MKLPSRTRLIASLLLLVGFASCIHVRSARRPYGRDTACSQNRDVDRVAAGVWLAAALVDLFTVSHD